MERELWKEIVLPPGDQDLLWEIFHENSKISPHYEALPDEEVRSRMGELYESLPFQGYPAIDLPRSLVPVRSSLEEAISKRVSARTLAPCNLSLEALATVLHYAYGAAPRDKSPYLSRSFRMVPSGGALYPLEIFLYSASVAGLPEGICHYNPVQHRLRLLYEGDHSNALAKALVQSNVGSEASLTLFITAIFERSTFKYGDRGYRFILLEAGHVAQNICLVATGLGLACLTIGGFLDREVDDLLGLDGVTHSTIYIVAVGGKAESTSECSHAD